MSSTLAPAGTLAACAATQRSRLTWLNANSGLDVSQDFNATGVTFKTIFLQFDKRRRSFRSVAGSGRHGS